MQETITYGSHIPTTLKSANNVELHRQAAEEAVLRRMVAESAVVVVTRKGCCMGHVAKRLLQGLGANPAVYEVEENGFIGEGRAAVQLPVVFVGGRWLGGLDRIIASHITGELTPLLKKAGALWL